MKYADRVRPHLAPGRAAYSEPLSPLSLALLRKLHQTIHKITVDFDGRWHFNTCIAAIMELVNTLTAAEPSITAGEVPDLVLAGILRDLVLLLAPFAPYLTAELGKQILGNETLLRAQWPKYDESLAREEEIEVPVQINGKLRAVILVARDSTEEALRDAALADEKIQAAVAGKTIVKIIIVPGKLVNIVVQ
jgi:leucyl-tRNA synthetase